ncbi:hypothetical protein JIN81_00380 [Haloferula rosea]|uniref:Verru_Chthon cassette protein A n=2 Tax=Haloferula rosea TaxID=490093 RepID=A0A934R7P5_9BACT|nr:hypothetical protein [Haloferula rosea]
MNRPQVSRVSQRGFALIITISMMVLLVLMSVGLLSLSSVSLRASSQSAAQSVARANAHLALVMAIGDLQKYAGPDTRVTARADILDESNPPVLGVWRSWEGEDHEQDGQAIGRPVAPDYDSKDDRLLSWMVSGGGQQLPATSPSPNRVTLLGEGSVGSGGDRDDLQIHLDPIEIEDGKASNGAFAWWVSGENQKARIPNPVEMDKDTNGQWAARMKSHSVADPEVFRMGRVFADKSLAAKTTTLGQGDFFAESGALPVSQEFYHDLSASSVGLQTNVATGGWKKDLSLFTESSSVGSRSLPLFRVAPGEDLMARMPTSGSPSASKSIFYPWASYRGNASSIPIYQHGPVTSWANLIDYATAYKRVNVSSSGRATIRPASEQIRGNAYNFLHKVRMLPVIARIQWVFSHSAAPSSQRGARPGDLEGRLLMTPVVTMWNPYNVEMTFSSVPLRFALRKPLPVAFRYKVNGTAPSAFNSLIAGNTNHNPPLAADDRLQYVVRQRFTLMPGETKLFSPASNTAVEASMADLELRPGYRARGGHYFEIKNGRRPLSGPPSTTIQADARFDTVYQDRETGVGIYLNMNFQGGDHLVYRMVYTPEVARQVYPELTGMGASTLGEAMASPRPFMTTVFGARMASRTHLSAKGFVQSSPLVNYTAMGGKDRVESTISRHYGGTDHPVNSPFDYSFQQVSQNDSLLPNESDASNRGYIVTGFTKADGLSRCVIAEIPTRPLQSLGELQHWDLRYENPIPPFAFNLIGNSDASPLLPPDAVVNQADAGLSVNLQHDDSYCANHLLFDDWFFSSIAPDPDSFGTNGRSQKDVFTDLVQGNAPLPNVAYKPIQEDVALASGSSSEATKLYQEEVDGRNSWKTIASRLEVEGMFNVNSTSVTAWRALLRHARDQEIPYIEESAGGWNVDLSSPTDHAFSRFSVAGDVEATEQGSSGAFPEAAEFAGYRKFDEEMLDRLAEEIVEQVRRRGPFLSLSEFVNRQLSSGDLALAGAVQSALNELANDSSSSPYGVIESVISRPSVSNPPGANNAEYQFPDAAVGQSTYGLPGWTRQADVLRALAPTITARDDTFTVRAYGEARDAAGRITATSVCEAVVQRTRDYVDPSDEADIEELPDSEVNRRFGRRMKLVSFRWLNASEV